MGSENRQTTPAATSKTPVRQLPAQPQSPTTGIRERGKNTSRGTGRSSRQKAATRRSMRREDRVTVQGPVKKQQPDGMSHRVPQGAVYSNLIFPQPNFRSRFFGGWWVSEPNRPPPPLLNKASPPPPNHHHTPITLQHAATANFSRGTFGACPLVMALSLQPEVMALLLQPNCTQELPDGDHVCSADPKDLRN